MDRNRESRVLDLFECWLDWQESERGARLDEACAGDAALRAAVERLIDADARATRVLPTEVVEPGAIRAALDPPDRIGVYRITGLLGRGGMGEVWRGERDDGLFEQAVAIKLTWPGLLGADAAQLFDSERRILARLNHPNIARLYDGGVDPGGRSYFIMEIVTGKAIDEYVRDARLDERACRKLAWQVCRAVEYAHQQMIVHADLKPSNILIGADGAPKLADFGIARLLLAEGPDGGHGPTTAAIPLTRAYASPQRLGGSLPVISDDVYSLGVIFQELLDICSPKIDPDLAAVLAKARHEDAAVRYESVTALRADLERYGRHEPVSARPRTPAYVFRKLLRRNRLAAGFVTTAALGLVATSIVMTLLYVRAERARVEADHRFAEVGELSHFMLFDLFDRLEGEPRSLPTRREVAEVSQRYLENLADDVRASPELRLETIEGLLRLASVQGRPGSSSLGRFDEATANLDRAERIAASLVPLPTESSQARLDLLQARIEMERARILEEQETSLDVALQHLDAAHGHLDSAVRAGLPAADSRRVSGQWHVLLAQVQVWQSRYVEAAAAARKAIALVEQDVATGGTPGEVRAREMLLLRAAAENALGDALFYGGDPYAAQQTYLRQLQLLEGALSRWPDHFVVLRMVAKARWNLGVTMMHNGDFAGALPVLERGATGLHELRLREPLDADTARMERVIEMARAQALAGLRRFDEAIPIMERSIEARRAAAQEDPQQASRARDYATSLFMLADVQREAGRTNEACRLYEAGFAVFDELRRTGRIAQNDQDYAVRIARENSEAACGDARRPATAHRSR